MLKDFIPPVRGSGSASGACRLDRQSIVRSERETLGRGDRGQKTMETPMTTGKELSKVVRKLCLCCQGQSWKLVRECAQKGCSLHVFRDGAADDDVLRSALDAFCLACAGSTEEVLHCPAGQAMGSQPPCPAHPFRPGAPRQRLRTLPGLVTREASPAPDARPAGEAEAATALFPLEFLAPEAPDI